MFYFDYTYFTVIIDFLNDKLFPLLCIFAFLGFCRLAFDVMRWYR